MFIPTLRTWICHFPASQCRPTWNTRGGATLQAWASSESKNTQSLLRSWTCWAGICLRKEETSCAPPSMHHHNPQYPWNYLLASSNSDGASVSVFTLSAVCSWHLAIPNPNLTHLLMNWIYYIFLCLHRTLGRPDVSVYLGQSRFWALCPVSQRISTAPVFCPGFMQCLSWQFFFSLFCCDV